MKYSETKEGRVFVIRLFDGEILHETIERFAVEKSITAATVIAVGGADKGSILTVGPVDGRESPVTPMTLQLDDVYEISGNGTLFPDEEGKPVLHMHIACGRNDKTITGCVRTGVKVWQVVEVVLTELLECSATRVHNPETGFKLLQP